jgi:organic hydroperoxide reductase OsmC/OhrA
MVEESDGSGRFAEVVLRPAVIVSQPAMVERATQLHERAGAMCFIARSVNFPVRHEPSVVASAGAAGPDPRVL